MFIKDWLKNRKAGHGDLGTGGSCAFTGHRPQSLPFRFNESDPRCIMLKARLKQEINDQISKGVYNFISGMALGVDTWAAEIVLEKRMFNKNIKLICAIPCRTQSLRWSPEAVERYDRILSKADEVVYVGEQYTHDCMMNRNKYMVDRADSLIAVYSGAETGGTAATVKYAATKNKEIIIIDPDTIGVSRY